VTAHVHATRAQAARFGLDSPQWWIYVAAAAAWGVLLLGGTAHAGMHAGDGSDAFSLDPLGEALFATAMSLAMMAPLAAPAARYVALAGRVSRRTRGPLIYVAVFVGLWTIVALGLSALAAVLSWAVGPQVVLVLVTAGAAAWQLTRMKRAALLRCARTEPMGGRGWRADLACARYGWRSARSCVSLCWAMMALVIATDHALLVTIAVFALQVRERSSRRDVSRFGATALAAIGLAVVLLPGPTNATGPVGSVAGGDWPLLVCPVRAVAR
jgi:predicted metal-binding membrane protein